MKRNTKIIAGVVVVILLGASFYAGTVYGKSAGGRGQFAGGQFGNGQFMRGTGTGTGAGMRVGGMGGANGGFTAGQILSKDETGITLKLQDGSTKIVLMGPDTQVMREASSTIDDLSQGQQVTVTGTQNADGSITARSVQAR
jgi:hypothetical protein